MSDINTVLERLITDPGFRRQIKEDPEAALSQYHLSESDMEMLASQVSDDAGDSGGVETRTSKSALAGLLGLFGGGGGSQAQQGETDLDFVSGLSEREVGDDQVGKFQEPTKHAGDDFGRVKPQFQWDGGDGEEAGLPKLDEAAIKGKSPAAADAEDNLQTPGEADQESGHAPFQPDGTPLSAKLDTSLADGDADESWVDHDEDGESPTVDGRDYVLRGRGTGDETGGGSNELSMEDSAGSETHEEQPGNEESDAITIEDTDEPSALETKLEKARVTSTSYQHGALDEPDAPDDLTRTAPSEGEISFNKKMDSASPLIGDGPEGNDVEPPDDYRAADHPELPADDAPTDGASKTMARTELSDNDPDQPLVVGSVPNTAEGKGDVVIRGSKIHPNDGGPGLQPDTESGAATDDQAASGQGRSSSAGRFGFGTDEPTGNTNKAEDVVAIQDPLNKNPGASGGDLTTADQPDEMETAWPAKAELSHSFDDTTKDSSDLVAEGSEYAMSDGDEPITADLESDGIVGPKTEPEQHIEGTDVSTGSYVGAEPIGDELPEDPPADD